MFAATHMAVGAFVESRVRDKAPTALIALVSHAAMDMTILWHARGAQYEWPEGSFTLFHVVPYPHDIVSWFLVAFLVISFILVAVFLRRYWWGMIWAVSPDIMDFIILRPLTSHYYIHGLFKKVSTPWGFGLETVLVVAVVVLVLYLKGRKQAAGGNTVS